MNKLHVRGNCKKGVTPVIATIILIAGTLVLALVVGAYTFGLFGSNVKTVTLPSATLYSGNAPATGGSGSAPPSGSAYITFSLNNPGSGSTTSSMTLTGSGGFTAITSWENAAGTTIISNNLNSMPGGTVTSYTFYPFGTAEPISTGQTYTLTINFANGQSVTTPLIAQ